MIKLQDLREVPQEEALGLLKTLAGDLRSSDLDEIKAVHSLEPFPTLVSSVLVSDRSWLIMEGDRPITVFGCAPSGAPHSGLTWMMGSPRMDEVAIRLGRMSRHCLKLQHQLYPCLWNYIDARNEASMRWLRWCGFELLEAIPEHGREQRLFFKFARYDPACVSP